MDNFKEYMWYLLTTPFKRVKKSINAWWAWCQVIGGLFDEAKEALEIAREEGMIATCSPELLPVHAAERRLTRYAGESEDNFRKRIAMYEEVSILGGLSRGILLAVKSLGYEDAEIISVPDFLGDDERWAEFYLILNLTLDEVQPVTLDILKRYVRRWKKSAALDNYFFRYKGDIKNPHTANVPIITYRKYVSFWTYLQLDGKWQLDGSYLLNADINTYPTYIGYTYQGGSLQEYVVGAMADFQSGSVALIGKVALDMFGLKTSVDMLNFFRLVPKAASYRMATLFNHTSALSLMNYMLDALVEPDEYVKATEDYLLNSDYFNYLKLNGLWTLSGSKLLDSQWMEYNTTFNYESGVYNTMTSGKVTFHKEHNLFYLDGAVLLDGSRNLDAYEETEVL